MLISGAPRGIRGSRPGTQVCWVRSQLPPGGCHVLWLVPLQPSEMSTPLICPLNDFHPDSPAERRLSCSSTWSREMLQPCQRAAPRPKQSKRRPCLLLQQYPQYATQLPPPLQLGLSSNWGGGGTSNWVTVMWGACSHTANLQWDSAGRGRDMNKVEGSRGATRGESRKKQHKKVGARGEEWCGLKEPPSGHPENKKGFGPRTDGWSHWVYEAGMRELGRGRLERE